MSKRVHQYAEEVEATSEKGGGETYVQDEDGMTIDKMYARMLATGELQSNMARVGNRMNKEQAHALIKAAREVPTYMKDGEKFKIQRKMEELDKNLKQEKIKNEKEKQKQEIINEYKKTIKQTQETTKKTTPET